MMLRRTFLAGAVAPVLGGCATGARVVPLESDLLAQPTVSADWTALGIPGLGELVGQAWRAHPDVEVARAAAALARAAAARADAGRMPLLQANLNSERARQGQQWGASAQLGAQLSWELDLGGSQAFTARAASLRAKAQEVLVQGAKASLACEVAAALLAASVEEHRLDWAAQYHALLGRRREVVSLKLTAGLVSRQEELAARAHEAAALRQLHRVEGERAEAVARLGVLLGDDPAGLAAVGVLTRAGLPRLELGTPTVQGELLLQRPDLAAADLECRAVSAELSAAERARLPSLNLGAMLGVAAGGLAGLASGVTALTLSQAFQFNLLDGGRWAADVDYARAHEKLAASRYRQKAWAVMREALVAVARYRSAYEELQAARASQQLLAEQAKIVDAARAAGLVDALGPLDAEQTKLERQALLLESAQLVSASIGRVLSAGAGPLPGMSVSFMPLHAA